MSDPSPTQALIFDVFGTVVDWRRSIAREANEFAARHGLDLDGERFADDWRALYQPAMARVREGQVDFVKLDVLHRMNLDELLARHGIEGLPEAEIDRLNRAWHRLDPWPDTVPGLTRLHRKFILGTMSNGNVALMVNMARRAGLPWDVILGGDVVRHYKPDPQSYLKSVDLLSLQPGETMLVAAHPDDLRAAAKCGLRTAYVRRPEEHGPNTYKEPDASAFDHAADDFLDLAEQLGC
ncbi:MAG: haloacid dehalogenase type II [Alphaproteobacteria bacterium]